MILQPDGHPLLIIIEILRTPSGRKTGYFIKKKKKRANKRSLFSIFTSHVIICFLYFLHDYFKSSTFEVTSELIII